MRFLCLPGAYGSIEVSLIANSHDCRLTTKKFKVQLAPLVKELESDNSASFYFLQGPYEVTPPTGYEEFFGGPPYYRFIVPSDADCETVDVLERIRDFPQLETPEMTMRELMTYGVAKTDDSARATLEYLYTVMEKEGPFDGVLGYSEGGTIAGTLLLHEQMREKNEGRIPILKCALFFGGWPPMRPTLDGIVLADESDLMIDVPTVHIGETMIKSIRATLISIQSGLLILIFTAISLCTTFVIRTLRSYSIMLKGTPYHETNTWSRSSVILSAV
jgi:hypothetical protein